MIRTRRWAVLLTVIGLVCVLIPAACVFAQGAPDEAPDAIAAAGGGGASSMAFWAVVTGSGILGDLLWLGLFASLFGMIWFAVDAIITVRPTKIMPQSLVDKVTEAIGQGDILKALNACENEPGPLANILSAGFSHVEEGFETIQEAIGVAADLETEQMMQRIAYLSLMASVAPMLGLLGTVQGMIIAFAQLAAVGMAVISQLAAAIAQALYTTFAGLTVAIPAVALFYFFKNRASRITLRMEAITLELIKDLRNVEVVEE